MFRLVVIFALFITEAYQSDIPCGSSEYGTLKIHSMSNPIFLREGETFNADFEVDIKKSFPTTIVADVSLKKKVWFVWVPIPCVKEVGSCSYTLTCDQINKMQGQNVCPAEPGVVSRKVSLKIPAIPGAVKAVGGGDYELRIELKDVQGRKIACVGRKVTIKT